MRVYTNQIQILHFSDLHFGEYHICNADPSAARAGMPTLGSLIVEDLKKDFGATFSDKTDYTEQKEPPLIVAISGDFTQKSEHAEFEEATQFLSSLLANKLLNRTIDKTDIFMIPGNHDVQFSKKTAEERFQPYCSFYNKFFENHRPPQLAHNPLGLTQIHSFVKDKNKVLVAEINCCMYVEKDTIDSSRGQVAMDAIIKLRKDLKEFSIKNEDSNDYIKIAIIHHHIVLLPSFIEPGRGVDSVMNAGYLLEVLSEFNFHLILHGHKHYPHIFQYDPVPLWTESENRIPQLVIAGGSCGSKELPSESSKSCNTYCVINIKWHPDARQARVKIITRGLRRRGNRGLLTPDQWEWETVNESDKILTPYQTLPQAGIVTLDNLSDDKLRLAKYDELRHSLPVVEVMPSLIPGQAYEARAWITFHRPDLYTKPKLIKVEWTAGPRFKKQICTVDNNPNFCVSYQYWGSMLIEAKLTFEDKYTAVAYVYARMPKDES
jgi:predicted MPP superfamily phosphohydrolase